MVAAQRATSTAEIERVVRELSRRQEDWAALGLRERAGYLNACIAGVQRISRDWVHATCHAQRIDPAWNVAGEHWLSGPVVTLRCLRLMAHSLLQGAQPRIPWVRERGDQKIVGVVPDGLLERMVFSGVRAEVWLQPGKPPSQGSLYGEKAAGLRTEGGVALVLGAGNVSSIAARDLVHKLFVEDEVVVLKMHPVNEYLGPIFERAFAPLIFAGYLAIVYGDAEIGSHLCRHELVDSIHLTGSHHTHDAIVWGSDVGERARRKQEGRPLLHKRVTSELGCVSPVIVVPGQWSDSDLDYQARHVAGMVTNNASFNCNAAKAVIVQRQWSQREQFLDRLRAALAATPQRFAYYPGAQERYAQFRDRYANCEALGRAPEAGYLAWSLIADVEPVAGEFALTEEAFCGIVAEVGVDTSGAEDFLRSAVDFVNDHVWGSLSCMLVIDPATKEALGGGFEQGVAKLRYGGIAVNVWSGYLFGLSAPTWGAYPGSSLAEVGSGIGIVGNTSLLDHPQKSVIEGPFRAWPKPPWFGDHRNLAELGRRLAAFEASPGWRKVPGVALAAMRG